MVHILTVHWKEKKWIDIQLNYIKRYFKDSYKLYAFINKIDEDFSGAFDFCLREPVECCWQSESHAIKLNILADIACSEGTDSDYLIFIDGDAFPIKDIMPYIKEKVQKHKLIAVRRDENSGEIQPHPCFAATTIGFWKEIKGDWKPGYKWKNPNNKIVTDTGGNLLKIVREKKIDWLPILRTNKFNRHPLWYGVYGDLIYHHGAGFRTDPISIIDIAGLEEKFRSRKLINYFLDQRLLPLRILGKLLNKVCPRTGWKNALREVIKKNQKTSEDIFHRIVTDKDFWKEYI